jgi:hypothetical protein
LARIYFSRTVQTKINKRGQEIGKEEVIQRGEIDTGQTRTRHDHSVPMFSIQRILKHWRILFWGSQEGCILCSQQSQEGMMGAAPNQLRRSKDFLDCKTVGLTA